ncbi:hypothetical protein RRG08_023030 [Elysia crispata]|uniref:Uncharacterized protein n=1 Tax=Elysia crispata TaxID=231223 RepID=A0AAE1D1S4_9GAST|nr:hypothetical protein RRG08_023030 [Elysia crispata]
MCWPCYRTSQVPSPFTGTMNLLVVSLQVKYGNFIRLNLRLSTTEGGVWFYLGHLIPLSQSFFPMKRLSKQWKKRLLCEPNEAPLNPLSDVGQKGTSD